MSKHMGSRIEAEDFKKETLTIQCNRWHDRDNFVSLALRPDNKPLAGRKALPLKFLVDFVPQRTKHGIAGFREAVVEARLSRCEIDAPNSSHIVEGDTFVTVLEKTKRGRKNSEKLGAEIGSSGEGFQAKLSVGATGEQSNGKEKEYEVEQWTAKMFGAGAFPKFYFRAAPGKTFVEEKYCFGLDIVPGQPFGGAYGYFVVDTLKHLSFANLRGEPASAVRKWIVKRALREKHKGMVSVKFSLAT